MFAKQELIQNYIIYYYIYTYYKSSFDHISLINIELYHVL